MRISAVRWTLLVVFYAGSARESYVHAKPKAVFTEDGSGCPGFSQRTDLKQQTIVFNLKNRCQKPIHCTMNWEVSCENPGDSSPKLQTHEEEMDLAAGAAQALTAEAGCGPEARWRISPATWRCRFKSRESESASR